MPLLCSGLYSIRPLGFFLNRLVTLVSTSNYNYIRSCQCDETQLPAIQIIGYSIPTQVKQEHNLNVINLTSHFCLFSPWFMDWTGPADQFIFMKVANLRAELACRQYILPYLYTRFS